MSDLTDAGMTLRSGPRRSVTEETAMSWPAIASASNLGVGGIGAHRRDAGDRGQLVGIAPDAGHLVAALQGLARDRAPSHPDAPITAILTAIILTGGPRRRAQRS